MKKTSFFLFNQNNPGGSYIFNDDLTHEVYIEATSYEEAIKIALSLGIYFNGCEKGIDCECCGDRWYEPDLLNFPYSYGKFSVSEGKFVAERYKGILKENKDYQDKLRYDVIFPNVELYARFKAEKYGFEKNGYPNGYIYYLNKNKRKVYIKPKLKEKLEEIILR